MKIYLLAHGRQNESPMNVSVFFFRRSAMAAAERHLQDTGGEWKVTETFEHPVAHWETHILWMTIYAFPLLLRAWSLKRWIRKRCHVQNLNEDKDGKVKGSILRYGRLWLHRASNPENPDKYRRSQIEFCWHFGGGMRWLGAGMRLFDGDNERDITFRLGFWFGSLHLSLEDILPKRFGYPRHNWSHDTSIQISVDGGCDGPYVSIDLHHAGGDCFDCKGWNGPHWYWWPLNTLLGKPVYNSKPLTERPVVKQVLMPEASYPVTVTLTEDTWQRPRWPWPTVVRRAQIECPGGIPKPGKGENSYDCGEDGTYGLTCPASTVEEALEHLKASVMRDRERYGGKDWKPERVTA